MPDYNDIRNKLAFLPRPIKNVMDFIEGIYDERHYTYVDKGRAHEIGYALSYAISEWLRHAIKRL